MVVITITITTITILIPVITTPVTGTTIGTIITAIDISQHVLKWQDWHPETTGITATTTVIPIIIIEIIIIELAPIEMSV